MVFKMRENWRRPAWWTSNLYVSFTRPSFFVTTRKQAAAKFCRKEKDLLGCPVVKVT